MANTDLAPSELRADIQALRGIAILLVLLQHSGFGLLAAGYLGVDVFFVVSGYLIARILQRQITDGSFSFSAFYLRRAMRLLPAAYVVFAFTAVLAGMFLDGPGIRDLLGQLLGSVTFTANIALYLQTGYFEGAAQLKPLLHIWSLGIEEQFYLLLPAAMVFTPRRYWVGGTLLAFASSLALCLFWGPNHPSASFYLLPTRAWELALGVLGALAFERPETSRRLALAFWPAVVLLLLLPAMPTGALHPGPDALLVCVAALVVILRRHPGIGSNPVVKFLAWLGGWSYALYLVHWPLFAFANNAYVSPVPAHVELALCLLSLVLGYLLHRTVEEPWRHRRPGVARTFLSAAGASACILLAAFAFSGAGHARPREANYGFSRDCNFGDRFEPRAACSNSPHPRILVWGDSFAMHVVPAVVASSPVGVMQATSRGCGPFPSLAGIGGAYGPEWARDCIAFNESVLDYLSREPSIDVVVLASSYTELLPEAQMGSKFQAMTLEAGELRPVQGGPDALVGSISGTVARLHAMGKRVIVIAPPPQPAFDAWACVERENAGKLIFGDGGLGCDIPIASHRATAAPVMDALRRLPGEAGVEVIGFDEFLCDASRCRSRLGGVPVYADAIHLSTEASRRLGVQMALGPRLLRAAR